MELIDLVNFVVIIISNYIRWLTFLVESLALTVTVLLFWNYFCLLVLVFVLQIVFLPLANSDHIVMSVYIDFHQTHNGIPRFIGSAPTYSPNSDVLSLKYFFKRGFICSVSVFYCLLQKRSFLTCWFCDRNYSYSFKDEIFIKAFQYILKSIETF